MKSTGTAGLVCLLMLSTCLPIVAQEANPFFRLGLNGSGIGSTPDASTNDDDNDGIPNDQDDYPDDSDHDDDGVIDGQDPDPNDPNVPGDDEDPPPLGLSYPASVNGPIGEELEIHPILPDGYVRFSFSFNTPTPPAEWNASIDENGVIRVTPRHGGSHPLQVYAHGYRTMDPEEESDSVTAPANAVGDADYTIDVPNDLFTVRSGTVDGGVTFQAEIQGTPADANAEWSVEPLDTSYDRYIKADDFAIDANAQGAFASLDFSEIGMSLYPTMQEFQLVRSDGEGEVKSNVFGLDVLRSPSLEYTDRETQSFKVQYGSIEAIQDAGVDVPAAFLDGATSIVPANAWPAQVQVAVNEWLQEGSGYFEAMNISNDLPAGLSMRSNGSIHGTATVKGKHIVPAVVTTGGDNPAYGIAQVQIGVVGVFGENDDDEGPGMYPDGDEDVDGIRNQDDPNPFGFTPSYYWGENYPEYGPFWDDMEPGFDAYAHVRNETEQAYMAAGGYGSDADCYAYLVFERLEVGFPGQGGDQILAEGVTNDCPWRDLDANPLPRFQINEDGSFTRIEE